MKVLKLINILERIDGDFEVVFIDKDKNLVKNINELTIDMTARKIYLEE
jgi:predicted O-methyltransferase YrrM